MTTQSSEVTTRPATDMETIVIVPQNKWAAKAPATVLAPMTAKRPVKPSLALKTVRPKQRHLRFKHGAKGMTVVLRDQDQCVIKVCQLSHSGKFTLPLSKGQFNALTTGAFYVTTLVAHQPATTVKYTVAG